MRIAIIGSRHLDYKKHFDFVLEKLNENVPVNATEIVSGGAVGIDSIAERFAAEKGIKTKIFLPDYDAYGKKAPILRNIEIVEYCHYLIAIWDGDSRGTAFTVAKCVENGVPVKIITLPKE